MGKRELVALLNLSSWCLVMVERLFLTVPWGCLRFVIVVFPDHTHLLFLTCLKKIPSRVYSFKHCAIMPMIGPSTLLEDEDVLKNENCMLI